MNYLGRRGTVMIALSLLLICPDGKIKGEIEKKKVRYLSWDYIINKFKR